MFGPALTFDVHLARITVLPRRSASPEEVKAAMPALLAVNELDRACARRPHALRDVKKLREALLVGEMLAVRVRRRRVVQELEGVEVLGPMAEQAPEEETTWVSIELLDQDGVPMAFERFVVVADNGKITEGRLDLCGKAKVDGMVPGACKIGFPALDAREWSEAA